VIKRLLICAALMLLAVLGSAMASAQALNVGVLASPSADVVNLYAAGVTWAPGATPQLAGNFIYSHQLTTTDDNGVVKGTGTYLFGDLDAIPTTTKPFSVTTNIGTGIAQRVVTIGKIPIWIPTAAGVSWKGPNIGFQWNTGAAATIALKNNLFLIPNVRALKSNVSDSGYQLQVGFDIGWGK
jgi:hypothetical protein